MSLTTAHHDTTLPAETRTFLPAAVLCRKQCGHGILINGWLALLLALLLGLATEFHVKRRIAGLLTSKAAAAKPHRRENTSQTPGPLKTAVLTASSSDVIPPNRCGELVFADAFRRER